MNSLQINRNPRVSSRISIILFIVAAIASGFINGLLGAGGGILMIYAISFILKRRDADVNRKDIFANSLATMIPICIVSACMYNRSGAFENISVKEYVVPALAGGLIGALALDKLRLKYLNIIFAAIVIYSGISMLFR